MRNTSYRLNHVHPPVRECPRFDFHEQQQQEEEEEEEGDGSNWQAPFDATLASPFWTRERSIWVGIVFDRLPPVKWRS